MKKPLKIIILSHGPLASGLLASSELIVGKVENCHLLELNHGDSIEDFESRLTQIINQTNHNMIVLTDLFGGSPNHTVAKVLNELHNPDHITCFVGVNLPLLLEIVSLKDILKYEQLIIHLKTVCSESIFELNERLVAN